MDINKALKKQKKSYKRFIYAMGLVFFALPTIMVFYNIRVTFLYFYLALLEILILFAVMVRANNERLIFSLDRYKLKIRPGVLKGTYTFNCEKIALVHAEGIEDKLEIVILTTSKSRNKKLTLVNEKITSKYTEAAYHYYRLKKQNPEVEYYYMVITSGGYSKYKLLKFIYKNCVRAFYTESAIMHIKDN